MKDPNAGEYWTHRNGLRYYVMAISNTAHVREDHPPDVVYLSVTDGKTGPMIDHGKVWTRPLSDWHRSFTGPL